MFSRTFISLVAVAVLAPGSALAQGADAKSLDQRTQREVVARLEAALQRNYVFQDRIPAISAELDRRVQATPIDADQFAGSLSQGLVKASDDLHFTVVFDPDEVIANRQAKASGDTTTQARRDVERAANFGFRDARRLEGGWPTSVSTSSPTRSTPRTRRWGPCGSPKAPRGSSSTFATTTAASWRWRNC